MSGIDTQSTAHIRIGRIVSFIEHSVIVSSLSISSTTKVHILARVHWYTDHPRRYYLHSSIVFCSTVFDNESCSVFMPVSRIMCRCAISSPTSLSFDYGMDRVHVAVPLVKYGNLM